MRKAVGEHVELGIERLVLEQLLHQIGHFAQLGANLRHLLRREVAADRPEVQCDQRHQRDLRGERLRGGDADLEASARVEHAVGRTGDRRPHDVGDGNHASATLLRDLHRGKRVGGLAGLRDGKHERLGIEDPVAVAPLAGDVGLGGHPAPLLDQVPTHEAGVQGGTAAHDQHAVDLTEIVVAQAKPVEMQFAVVKALGDGVADRRGLLMDLLEHERLVATLRRNLDRIVGLLNRVLAHRAVGDGAVLHAVGLDDHDLGFVDDLYQARLLEEGGRERGDEVLAVAAANHQRRPGEAGGDDAIGLIEGNREEGKVALQTREDAAAGLREITVVLLLDQVDERLGVGVRRERVSAGGDALPELDVVLENAVHQDGEAAIL